MSEETKILNIVTDNAKEINNGKAEVKPEVKKEGKEKSTEKVYEKGYKKQAQVKEQAQETQGIKANVEKAEKSSQEVKQESKQEVKPVIIQAKEPVVQAKEVELVIQAKKQKGKVISANAFHYVVEVNGKGIRVNKKNTYKIGDIVEV